MSKPVTKSRQSIAEEAAGWFVDWREKVPARSEKARFAQWLSESPVHVEEYLAIAKLYGELAHVDPAAAIQIDELVDETVVALHGHEAVDATPIAPRRWGLMGLAASGVLAVIAAGVFLFALDEEPLRYSTVLGEQRSVVLEDGSMVSLNTSTVIEVHFTDETRNVNLLRGEALFDVEKDLDRAFLVETGSALIRVTGTQFNVYEEEDGTAVTVLEGEVEVMPREAPPDASTASKNIDSPTPRSGGIASLSVGDRALVKSGSAEIETTSIGNLEPVTAWTERRLVFDATPLSEIVKQFNRYNRQQLVLDDAALGALELSGVFGSHDPESFFLFLERIADVEIETSADGSEIRVRVAETTP